MGFYSKIILDYIIFSLFVNLEIRLSPKPILMKAFSDILTVDELLLGSQTIRLAVFFSASPLVLTYHHTNGSMNMLVKHLARFLRIT